MEQPPFTELLAPAGNLEKLKIAVLYGANAVYLAGPKFSLRAGSDNFSDVELEEGLAFANQYGTKIYVTLNAFLHDHDMEGLPQYIQFLESIGVHAVIVSDLGVLEVVRQHSNLAIHVSTQASCLNQYSAQFWKKQGAKRIVVGREVSIHDAGTIQKKVGVEIEMFVHGAMCMAYSGNCTISNYTLARDSNRGGCAQSCRFGYSFWSQPNQREAGEQPIKEDVSFMSSKDLRGVERIPAFVDHQIASLKIEGRMKSNLYVATTVQAYSNALKRMKAGDFTPEEIHQLAHDLTKIPHRQYTEAALMDKADDKSVYYGNRSGNKNSEYELAGTVLEVKKDEYITLSVQNPFESHHTLEVLTFDGKSTTLSVDSMRDLTQEKLQLAKQNRLIILPYVPGVEPLNLARKLVN